MVIDDIKETKANAWLFLLGIYAQPQLLLLLLITNHNQTD